MLLSLISSCLHIVKADSVVRDSEEVSELEWVVLTKECVTDRAFHLLATALNGPSYVTSTFQVKGKNGGRQRENRKHLRA